MKTALFILGLVTIGAVSSGCRTLSIKVGHPVIEPPELHVAETRYTELLDALGPPAAITSLPGGSAFLYESANVREWQLGVNFGLTEIFGNAFYVSHGRSNADIENLVMVFDDRGTVQGFGTYVQTGNIGTGFTLQFSWTVNPVLDTSYLQSPAFQSDWAMSLLEPLPVLLNAGQSMTSGTAGFELRGTPTSAGQRSLELRD